MGTCQKAAVDVWRKNIKLFIGFLCVVVLTGHSNGIVRSASAQESQADSSESSSNLIELPRYLVTTADTRKYAITGDKQEFFKYFTMPFFLPVQTRDIKTSLGLLTEEERLKLQENFSSTTGWHFLVSTEGGSYSHGLFHGKAGKIRNGKGVTFDIFHRGAEFNLPNNGGAIEQTASITGYINLSKISKTNLMIGIHRDSDKGYTNYNNEKQRDISGFESTWRFNRNSKNGSEFNIEAELYTSDYKGNIDSLDVFDVDEKLVNVDLDSRFFIFGIPFKGTAGYEADWIREKKESFFNSQILWNFQLETIYAEVGGRLFFADVPGNGLHSFGFGTVNMGWTPNSRLSFALRFKPGLENRSFRNIFEKNGLVTYGTLPFAEHYRRNEEFEINLIRADGGDLVITLGNSETKNPLVWTPSDTSQTVTKPLRFQVVPKIELLDRHISAQYRFPIGMKLLVDITGELHRLKFNGSDSEVPFKPETAGSIKVTWNPHEFWRLEWNTLYEGTRYTQFNSNKKLDGYMVTDFRIIRYLGKVWSLTFDINNLLSHEYSLWSEREEYKMPKIRVSLGITGAW